MTQSELQQLIALGLQHEHAGRLSDAADTYRRLLQHVPDHHGAIHLLGGVLFQLGRLPESVQAFRRSVESSPDDGNSWNDLGVALHTAGEYPEAIIAFRRSLALLPGLQQAATNLAEALRVTGQYEQSVAILHRVIAADPNCVDALNTLGASLNKLGRLPEAVDALQRAVTLNPHFTPAMNNLAVALWGQGNLAAAAATFERLLALKPNWSMGRYCLGIVQLLQGDFDRGFINYEHRRDAPELGQLFRRFSQPRWHGEPMYGKRILLHVEQGFGDMIQFVRYVPMVIQRGGRVILQCQPELFRLFSTIDGIDELILDGVVPEFDLECPLLSVPHALKTTPQSIPAQVPYLRADPAMLDYWSDRLAPWREQLKVGVVWAGRSTPDPARSVPPGLLIPLRDATGAAFFSLQKSDATRGASLGLPHLPLTDWTCDLKDFADTAALIQNLDVVVTVDTAVAHLAGALGKKTCLLLKFVPDWRWQMKGSTSRWYPTMRLFRQSSPGDWGTPIQELAAHLRKGL